MCGICGAVSSSMKPPLDRRVLGQMCQVIAHRGPDDEGMYLDRQVGLGMRRLSIIDLVTGNQPISNEDRTIWLVFNGEIYNYQALQTELISKGHRFATRSDTEVIVHAYEQYGVDCVERFNGMFAFALWDLPRRRLFVARDHLGIKPFYYWTNGELFVFGSELKAVITHPAVPREIDPVALDHFLTLEYIPSPRTIFENIHKLPAGHRLVFEDGKLDIYQYWDVPAREIPGNEATCVEMLVGLIDDAVRMQLISDVPLGAYLSGGIDSSTVVASMSRASSAPVKTFSIGFDDASYNELPFARAVAERYQTDHHEEILQPDIASMVERLVRHMDEPFGDFSIFPTYLVSEVARRKVKVVLSGDGGDELFGGYDAYVAADLDRLYRRLPEPLRRDYLPTVFSYLPPRPEKKGLVNKTKRFIEGAALPGVLQHARWMIFTSPADKRDLYHPDLQSRLNAQSPESLLESYFRRKIWADPLAQQQYVDIKTYLVDDILTKVDRMSMAVSLEARVPLLDYRLVELAVNLPAKMKLHRGQTKRILRRAMSNRLPASVLTKPKQGFSIPIKNWLRGELRPLLIDLLSAESIRQRGYFEPACVQSWVAQHLDGKANHSHRLWALMVFELWHRQLMDVPVHLPDGMLS